MWPCSRTTTWWSAGNTRASWPRCAHRAAWPACPYFGLARGFLTGKYRRDGEQVDSPRAAGVRESYFNERGFAVLDALDEIAAAHGGRTVAAVALAWLLAQPTVARPDRERHLA